VSYRVVSPSGRCARSVPSPFSPRTTIASSRSTSRIRSANDGGFVRFGQGDAPIKRPGAAARPQWAIPPNIENAYNRGDMVQEVKRCVEDCKAALEGPKARAT